jgi:hypothetical protein
MTLNRLQPLRKAADLAFYGATASGLGAHYVLLDKVKEEAECYRENGHRVPVILELVLSNDE